MNLQLYFHSLFYTLLRVSELSGITNNSCQQLSEHLLFSRIFSLTTPYNFRLLQYVFFIEEDITCCMLAGRQSYIIHIHLYYFLYKYSSHIPFILQAARCFENTFFISAIHNIVCRKYGKSYLKN